MGLFDSIGGGGGAGGIFGMIEQIADPLGLMKGLTGGGGADGTKGSGASPTGNGVMDGLSKIFDPLGIFPALKNEIDPAKDMKGDPNVAANAQKFMEIERQAKNIAADFKSDGAGAASGSAPADQSQEGTTECAHPTDPSQAGAGYAAPSEGSQNQSGPVASSSAATGVQVSPQDAQELSDIGILMANFDSMNGGQPLVNRDGLWNTMGKSDDQALVSAANFLYTHPDELAKVVLLSGRNDGCFTKEGLQKYLEQRTADIYGVQPRSTPAGADTQPKTEPPTSNPTTTNPTTTNPQSSDEKDPSTATGGGVMGDANQGWTTGVSSGGSIEDRIRNGAGGYMDALDKQIEDILNKGGELSSSDANKLQFLMGKRNEMFQLVSQMTKMFDEMAMTAIHNIR